MKSINDRVQDGVRDTIGNLTLQVIALQAQNESLAERLAALSPPPAGPPAPPEGGT